MLGEGGGGRDEGDALQSAVYGGGVVDCEALVGDYVFAFFVGEFGERDVFFLFFLVFFFLLVVVVVILGVGGV